jgi:hypothetical protein
VIRAGEGVSPLFEKLTPLTLPEPPDRPPKTEPPENPPLDDGTQSGPGHVFQDSVHKGCTYFHQFVIRSGPVQTQRWEMGWVVSLGLCDRL